MFIVWIRRQIEFAVFGRNAFDKLYYVWRILGYVPAVEFLNISKFQSYSSLNIVPRHLKGQLQEWIIVETTKDQTNQRTVPDSFGAPEIGHYIQAF